MSQRLEQLQQFLREAPGDPFIKYAIATEHLKLGALQTAMEGFEKLVTEHPDYLGTYYHLGKLLEQLSLTERAKQAYQQGMLVAQQAKNTHAYGELKGALQWIQNTEEEEEED